MLIKEINIKVCQKKERSKDLDIIRKTIRRQKKLDYNFYFYSLRNGWQGFKF